jgi:hypothetical protein
MPMTTVMQRIREDAPLDPTAAAAQSAPEGGEIAGAATETPVGPGAASSSAELTELISGFVPDQRRPAARAGVDP